MGGRLPIGGQAERAGVMGEALLLPLEEFMPRESGFAGAGDGVAENVVQRGREGKPRRTWRAG
jgi:hypothetical protein